MRHEFERYCKNYQSIENYEKAKKDNFKGWHCHHRLETHNSDGERRPVDITQAELKSSGMYYHRPSEELIFLTTREHNAFRKGKHLSGEARRKVSEARKGKKFSEEHRKKLSEAHKGQPAWNKGKHLSAETRDKISESKKGKYTGENHPMYGKKHSDETRRKMSAKKKGKKLSAETKNKISKTFKSLRWYNNGKINVRAKECPEGFTPGRLL